MTASVVPRWARWAAHAAALTPLPSGLWRIGLACGFHLGFTAQGFRDMSVGDVLGPIYLVALTLLTEAAALLTLGLVQPWGERVPRWIPIIGGRTVRPTAAVVPASIGAVIVAMLWTPMLGWWMVPHTNMTETGHVVIGFLYLPLVAWAPLLFAVTVSYYRRHRKADSSGRRNRTP